MNRKISIVILIIVMILLGSNIKAATDGDFEYRVENNETTITKYTGSATTLDIPDTLGGYNVTGIGDCAFDNCTSLINITIPNTVTSIGNSTFNNCTSLTSVTIPSSVISIGEGSFEYCANLTNINIDNDNKNYTSIDGVLFNKEKTKIIKYPIGNENKTYIIPDSVTSIETQTFKNCKNLVSIIIPNGITIIPYNAFSNCTNLENITIPNSVDQIGMGAFDNCTDLKTVIIPNGVTIIVDSAFSNCTNLTNIVIPNSVITIGHSAFKNCTNLTSITIPNSVETIDGYAFSTWNDNQKIYIERKFAPETWNKDWNINCNAEIIWGVNPFLDVSVNNWYYNAVKYCYQNNIMTGTNETTFSPSVKLTRGMLASILYKMEGAPKVSGNMKFSDVAKGKYYYNAVLWASQNNVVSGTSATTFNPTANVTRQDVAVMLKNYSNYKKKYEASNYDLTSFPDSKNVSKYAQSAMRWAVENKVINGSNGKLNPKGTATRSEAASMIYNYCNKIGR